ncbi:glycosyltransferase family 87 protein [Cognatiyoonia sp. IB215182]|uniref:glycosyltransferase family 87 protein n=1 Tax=Cognatiyoonia sp. IB215182 TaxID=3097353 RepID=UPI002A10AD17|nr:glycosyltransferase family 87 protein [Cognatiyoonia sp. IB215182]MDX8352187.1 glycosyltransferase family 87 protein [Cognatiyoonia sp. IB215182]
MSTHSENSANLSPHQRYYLLAWVNAITVLIMVATFVVTGIDVPGRDNCVTRFVDFHAIWGAARLALEMNPIAAFERQTLEQAYSACEQINMFWLYPAPMAVLLTPVGALPFLPAYIGFQVLSLGLLALAVRRYFPKDRTALIAIVFAPAWLPALMVGQFTILWCVGLLAAISAMRQDRHVLSGVLIGLLTLKPTLGLLIPVILLADRRYGTIISAIITTVILHLGATALYGFDYFTTWIAASGSHGASLSTSVTESASMASIAAFATRLGASPALGIAVNMTLLAFAAAALFWIWRKQGAQSDAACAVLCAAIPLSTPYLWHYDAGFSALAAMFIYRAGTQGWHALHWVLLGIVWAGPGITLWNTYFFHLPWVYPTIVVPPVLLIGFAFALWQVKQRPLQPETEKVRNDVTA